MVKVIAGTAGYEGTVKETALLGLLPIAVIGVGITAAYFLLKPKEGECWFFDAVCQARKAGKDVAQTVYNVAASQTERKGGILTGANVFVTQARSIVQGSPLNLKAVPTTPSGYSSSNWTWELPGGDLQCDASGKCTGSGPVQVGLPAGMTFGEFCEGSPESPMCKDAAFTLTKKGPVAPANLNIDLGGWSSPAAEAQAIISG